jgi:hypothetical protein
MTITELRTKLCDDTLDEKYLSAIRCILSRIAIDERSLAQAIRETRALDNVKALPKFSTSDSFWSNVRRYVVALMLDI